MSIFSDIGRIGQTIEQQVHQAAQQVTPDPGAIGHDVTGTATPAGHTMADILDAVGSAAGSGSADAGRYEYTYGIVGSTPIFIYDKQTGETFTPSADGSKSFEGWKGTWSEPLHSADGSSGAGTGLAASDTHSDASGHAGNAGTGTLAGISGIDRTDQGVSASSGPGPAVTTNGNTGIAPVVHTELDPATGKIIVTGAPTGADPVPSSIHTTGDAAHTGGFWEQAAQVLGHHNGDIGGKGLGSTLGQILDTIVHADHGHGLGQLLDKLNASGLPHWAEMAEQHGGQGSHGHVGGELAPPNPDPDGAHFAHMAHIDLHAGHGHVQ